MAYSDGRDGKGSRDPFVENWQQYGQRALSEYLLKNYTDYDNRDQNLNYGVYSSIRGSDPLGIIQDPSRLNSFFDPITARYDELAYRDPNLNYGYEVEPNRTFNPTKDEVQRFIDRQYADFMASGNPGNDAMWLPRLEGENVITGLRNSKGGFLDKITPALENAMALSGFAGPALGASIAGAGAGAGLGSAALEAGALAGAPGYGAALESSLAGLGGLGAGGIDASWGANPTGSFSPGSYNPADPLGFASDVAPNVGNLTTPVGDFTASQLPGGSLNATGAGVLGTGAGGLTLPNLPSTPSIPSDPATNTNVVENQGNVTGGGALNTNYTGAQIASALGLGGSSALQWLSQATGLSQGALQALGLAGSTALGVYGSNQQANALTDIANQARADRQPFLNKSLEWLNNPQAYQDTAGKSSLDAVLRGLSVQGNPFGSPTNIALAGDIANKNWQNAVTGFGNIGLAGQDSRSQLLSNAATADRGVTASLASGLGSLTQPDNSLEGILRRLQGTNSLNLGNYLT